MSETEIIKSLIFYGFSGLTLLFALLSVLSKNILYSLLFAVIAFFNVGGLFFSLGADYNAIIQIAIYGIAIPVIILFAIMLTNRNEDSFRNITFSPRFFIALISSALLFMILWYSIAFSMNFNSNILNFFNQEKPILGSYVSIISMANTLYVNYSVPLILFSIIILTVVVGISVLNVIREKNRG